MRELSYSQPDQPALDEVVRTDLLLDALAERAHVDLDDRVDPNDEELAALLEGWRDDLRWPPASALVSQEQAVRALRAGFTERRRNRRGLATVGSVAVTLLLLSGVGAMVVDARPGDALYGLHAMFFDQPRVNDDQVSLSTKGDLLKVQQLIDEGQWDQAQSQLTDISAAVQSMKQGRPREALLSQLALLNTRVQTHDPNATLLPQAPAETPSPPRPKPSTSLPAPGPTPPAAASATAAAPAPTSAPPSPAAMPSTPTKSHKHPASPAPSAPVARGGP